MWPVLVTDLADPATRDFLEGIALAGGTVSLRLVAPPANAAIHVLEIHTPGAQPLVVFAEPSGPPTADGHPLRLTPYDSNATVRPVEPQRLVRNPDSLVGRPLAGGKLRIDSLIGTGGVGCVYRAFHRDLRTVLAVKVLHEDYQTDIDFCRRFHAEALTASGLDHPNLMRVLDFGQEPDGLLYLAMEHLDGKSLGETLELGTPISVTRALDIMVQVCAGLAHAHLRGIVHRDIKPDNIVLVASRNDDDAPIELVKVCDFGIAVQQTDGPSSVIVGTPQYMSPEQCAGATKLDGRSDIYACGVVLYELVTGQLPFMAKTAVQLLNRHMNVPPPPPRTVRPDVPIALEALILKALAKEPSERQQSMRELRNELRSLDGSQSQVPSHSPALSGMRPAMRTEPEIVTSPPDAPDWLERGGSYSTPSMRAAEPTTGVRRSSSASLDMTGQLLANELSTKAAPWLANLAEVNRVDVFEELIAQLAFAVPVLIAQRNVRTLFAVRSTIDVLAHDDGQQPSWRLRASRKVQLAFEAPPLLAMLAELVLTGDAVPREVMELLLRAGTPSAYALYSARLKLANHPGVSKRFVESVHRFGVEALPMIRAGLAKLENRRELLVASSLAADLFAASPRVRDDIAGELGARYVESGSNSSLTRAALDALTGFWGDRAAPILLGLLNADDETIQIGAIEGLRALHAVDEHVALKVDALARSSRSSGVVTAAKTALADGSPVPRAASQPGGVRKGGG